MGSFAPRGHARVDPRHPAAFAICDCCGFLYNHRDLRWNTQWHGRELRSTGFLRCPKCIDVPNPGLIPIILPPDPVPILNPRREPEHCHVFRPRSDAVGVENNIFEFGADSTLIFADNTHITADQTHTSTSYPAADTFSRMFPPIDMWRDVTVDAGSTCDTRTFKDGFSVPVPPPIILLPGEVPIEPPDATTDNLEATADATGTTVDASPIFEPVLIPLNVADTTLAMADNGTTLAGVFPDYVYGVDMNAITADAVEIAATDTTEAVPVSADIQT
jgi:hypothetical protein